MIVLQIIGLLWVVIFVGLNLALLGTLIYMAIFGGIKHHFESGGW